MRYLLPVIVVFSLLAGCLASCKVFQKRIVANVLDHAGNWLIEQQPNGSVAIGNGKMEIVDAKGCTVWLKQKLKGDVRIQYDVTVIQNNGPFDRVSDLNCFWMANDPGYPNDFFAASEKRAGLFPNYHHLTLYLLDMADMIIPKPGLEDMMETWTGHCCRNTI